LAVDVASGRDDAAGPIFAPDHGRRGDVGGFKTRRWNGTKSAFADWGLG
jgi:hypothetical protein